MNRKLLRAEGNHRIEVVDMLIKVASAMYLMDRADHVRPNTFAGYRSSLSAHVIPDLGDIEMEEFTPQQLQEYLLTFKTKGVAVRTYTTIRQLFNWSNRVLGIQTMSLFNLRYDMPDGDAYMPSVLDRQQTMQMITAIAGQPWEAVIALCVLCGLRKCEACGLMWEDINLDTREIMIRRGRHYCQGQDMILPPKTKKSAGVVVIPKFYIPRLRALQMESGFLCDLPPNVLSKKYKDFIISNSLPYVPMKNLRHSWATQALEAGMSLEDIMMYLRHTQMSTSYEHYIVRTNKMIHRIADIME